jgi:hypothetical protein
MAINKLSDVRNYVRLRTLIFGVLVTRNAGSVSSVYDAVERELEIYYRNPTDGNLLHLNTLYDL